MTGSNKKEDEIFLYTSGMGQKDIPESVKRVKIDVDVRRIEYPGFSNQRDMYEVDFSEATSLTGIMQQAFNVCESLLEVDFPSSVNTIVKYAFFGCKKMVTVKNMQGLRVIGVGAFAKCVSLREVEIPSSVNRIEENTFFECYSLTNVQLMEGLQFIGKNSFLSCVSLSDMEIPSSVYKIDEAAFRRCVMLNKVKLMEGRLKVIGLGAFDGCESLLDIDFPSSLERIEDIAFRGCKKLKNTKMTEGLKTIGRLAFACCEVLSEVDIPSSVTKIESGAFFGCKKFTSTLDKEAIFIYKEGMRKEHVPKNVMRVKIDSNVTKIQDRAFLERWEVYQVDFSEAKSLKEIGAEAFCKCTSLSEVEIPLTVNKIKEKAFSECSNLKIAKMMEGLQEIGKHAFSQCESLMEVEVPSSISKIEDGVFSSCKKLERVKLIEGVQLIGKDAFKSCESLEVEIPSSVTYVGTDAFADAKSVTSPLEYNLALGIRLCAIHPRQTQETIQFDQLVQIYAHKPIKPQELQDPHNEGELSLLESVKHGYIKLIKNLTATNNPSPNGWVQFVTNYEDYANDQDSKILIDFLNTADKEIISVLANAKDKHGRSALKTAVPSIRKVFLERLLFQARYDIESGPPIHKSATCVVVKAEDTKMHEYYRGVSRRFDHQNNGLDKQHFGAALQAMDLIGNQKSELVDKLVDEYFERVDVDKSGNVSEDEFAQFCLRDFGSNVVLKFMRNKDQFQRELDGRKTTSGDQEEDEAKDGLLAKYVVSVIRSHEIKEDIANLKDTVKPYLSEAEKPEDYCHVLVMPYGDRNLDTIFRSERPDLVKVRGMLKDVGEALLHLHRDRNLVHGDLKMLNVVRVQGRLSLIDLDASAKIGSDYAGAKFSSGVLPPEMVHCLKDSRNDTREKQKLTDYYQHEDENERTKRASKYSTYPRKGYTVKSFLTRGDVPVSQDALPYDLVKADPSLDVWAFGVLLYAMCTGEQSLFSVSRDDDIVDGNGFRDLCDWGTESLKRDRNLDQKVTDQYAKDLLLWILKKDPSERPTMAEVLDHAFFKTEKQENAEIEKLTKIVERTQAIVRENQKIMKREFEKLQELMQLMMKRQVAMQSMLKDIIGGLRFPKYLVILPKKEKKGMLSWLSKKTNLKAWMYKETEARICFVCPISLRPVIGPDGEAIGYDRKLPKEWVKEYGPAILIGLKMLQVGFAVGRGFGLPFPSLGDANDEVAETLGEASDLLSSMQDIAMEQLGLEQDDDLADLFVDKLSETTEEALSADDVKISDGGRKHIQQSYEGIGKLVRDEEFKRCGLVEATCKDDGTTEFVHPDLKALYEEKGQAILQTMAPEMIDKAAAVARADVRNVSQSEAPKTARTASFSSEAELSRLPHNLTERTYGDGFLDEKLSRISKQIHEMQQESLSIRDGLHLSSSRGTIGTTIVHDGCLRIQSQSFPHLWKERQFFLHHNGSIRHFPASGEWFRPSNGRWRARKAENGDGIDFISDGKVCTRLRLSGSIKYSSKSPEDIIDEWVTVLNSSAGIKTPQADTDLDQQSKPATIRSIDFTGQVESNI